MIKSSILLVAAIFLLCGSVGVNIFSHFCKENKLEVSYFVENEDHCKEERKDPLDSCCKPKVKHTSKETSSCCKPEVKHAGHASDEVKSCCDTEEDSDCCKDEIKHVKFKLDFHSEVSVLPVIIPELEEIMVVAFNEFPVEISSVEYKNNSPPPESGKDIILKKQNWLI